MSCWERDVLDLLDTVRADSVISGCVGRSSSSPAADSLGLFFDPLGRPGPLRVGADRCVDRMLVFMVVVLAAGVGATWVSAAGVGAVGAWIDPLRLVPAIVLAGNEARPLSLSAGRGRKRRGTRWYGGHRARISSAALRASRFAGHSALVGLWLPSQFAHLVRIGTPRSDSHSQVGCCFAQWPQVKSLAGQCDCICPVFWHLRHSFTLPSRQNKTTVWISWSQTKPASIAWLAKTGLSNSITTDASRRLPPGRVSQLRCKISALSPPHDIEFWR